MGRTGINKNKIQPTNSMSNVSAYPISSRFRTNLTGKSHHIFKPEKYFLKKDNNNEEYLSNDNRITHNKNNDIMVSLAAILKKRENQISKSVDKEFEISNSTIISTLSSYIGKDDDISNKIGSEYKHKMDEHAEDKLNNLRKLQLGFEKYQLIKTNLLEALDKNYSHLLRVQRDFEKDMKHMREYCALLYIMVIKMEIIMEVITETRHQTEITNLYEEIEKYSQHLCKNMENAAKETRRRPSISKQLNSLFRF
ncbi:hypothetical protein Glove_242g71 [Diversispora epigaea]|uniref:Uncharacterized protein n=1 Tax=Diversispora epigaea TaxID=1348612 RepID=A0A397I9U2_9GLOM|nr:hypothetical protein Glove_242g71 [Diversispora epigaea]